MSERDKAELKYADFSIEDVGAFLDSRGVDRGCPMCRTDAWIRLTHEEGQGTALLVMNRNPPSMNNAGAITTTALACKNCGFVWQILNEWVEKWLAAGKPGR